MARKRFNKDQVKYLSDLINKLGNEWVNLHPKDECVKNFVLQILDRVKTSMEE